MKVSNKSRNSRKQLYWQSKQAYSFPNAIKFLNSKKRCCKASFEYVIRIKL